MIMIKMNSTNVDKIGYDSKNSTLVVKFINGSSYQYYGVPSEVYQEFLSAESPGSFVHRVLIPKYKYKKL